MEQSKTDERVAYLWFSGWNVDSQTFKWGNNSSLCQIDGSLCQLIDRSESVSFPLSVYMTRTIQLLFDSGIISLLSEHVNSNMVFLLDNKMYLIMRNRINTLIFFSTILFLHVHPLIWFCFGPLLREVSDQIISGVLQLIRSWKRPHRWPKCFDWHIPFKRNTHFLWSE